MKYHIIAVLPAYIGFRLIRRLPTENFTNALFVNSGEVKSLRRTYNSISAARMARDHFQKTHKVSLFVEEC